MAPKEKIEKYWFKGLFFFFCPVFVYIPRNDEMNIEMKSRGIIGWAFFDIAMFLCQINNFIGSHIFDDWNSTFPIFVDYRERIFLKDEQSNH